MKTLTRDIPARETTAAEGRRHPEPDLLYDEELGNLLRRDAAPPATSVGTAAPRRPTVPIPVEKQQTQARETYGLD